MTKTITILSLLLLVLLAGCNSEEETEMKTISFGAVVEGVQTRAGQTGCMDDVELRKTGFGVFAYGMIGGDWSNQQLTYYETSSPTDLGEVHVHPTGWSYGSSKDWTSSAFISFYAYAPFVGTSGSDFSGGATPGITTVTGDPSGPTVSYTVDTDPAQSVDLLWGVKGTTGLPWLNATLSNTGGNILFTFRHAVAAIGLHAQAMVDSTNDLTDLDDESRTWSNITITLKSVTITPQTNSFYGSGTLNLKNSTANTPAWTPGSRSITNLSLNSLSVNVPKNANTQVVIPKSGGKEQFFMVIPDAAQDYAVSATYDIAYKDLNGTDRTKTDVTGTATFSGLELKGDTKYYLNLVIGLKTLNLSVSATDWNDVPVNLDIKVEKGTSASESLAPKRNLGFTN